ncbi:DNA-binding MarR family transcriptional regulator [Psychromicrobium silvestre]|uniref:DNA-binding MarR family transcriptional regulator n=1 Tax=Psychromicrobium silvestre TaxID=1645614 RepID=A0A7Y9LRV6_9MICC|nr:MarR family transcriptional regulator [Psychromicrobium silvestre]NYE94438.1 DNA-binding MarR family transcriptional regulator [Psychromicrobium silvestre]
MSSESAEKAVASTSLGLAMQTYQASVQDFDREVARILGVNETDLRCLEVLLEPDSADVTPTILANRLGLTTGSVTTMLDRLTNAGYVARAPHPTDRRRLIVHATQLAVQKSNELYGPLINAAAEDLLPHFSTTQLKIVVEFLQAATKLQQTHFDRLRTVGD